ncbi:MAG: hypothetical protein LBU62_10395 [Bacteroidales bacterium]|jgi:hypothetical protein|nr:hypothetical protein [Bacteroidales bacterium]
MKANFLLVLALSLMMVSCGGGSGSSSKTAGTSGTGEVTTNDLTKERLSGKVKSIRQRVYWALEKFGRIEKGKLQNLRAQDYLREYNEKGFLTEETFFDLRDSVVSARKITYSQPGQIEKEELYDGKKLSSVIRYTYENGKLQQKEISDGEGKLKERYAYSYYDSGWLMDEDKYNAGNQLAQKIVHVYDDKTSDNKLSEKQYYWGGGSPYKKETMEYSASNFRVPGDIAVPEKEMLASIVTTKYQNKEEIFDGWVKFENYNQFGDYQTRTLFDKNDEKIEISEYSYDKYGNLTRFETRKRLITPVAEPTEPAEPQEPNEDGEESEEDIEEDEAGEDINGDRWDAGTGAWYDYACDEQNNWTRKITYKIEAIDRESIRQFYYERTITYY